MKPIFCLTKAETKIVAENETAVFFRLLGKKPPSRDTYFMRNDLRDLYKIKDDEILLQNRFNYYSSPHNWIVKLHHPSGIYRMNYNDQWELEIKTSVIEKDGIWYEQYNVKRKVINILKGMSKCL